MVTIIAADEISQLFHFEAPFSTAMLFEIIFAVFLS